YIPINQTGTYTILTHSGLFGGNSTTEEISIAAKFTNIPQLNKDNEIKPGSIIIENGQAPKQSNPVLKTTSQSNISQESKIESDSLKISLGP
ncbi:hypothetical protein C6988_10280, partial [Nitrosopumilus sp. b1]|uniref:hypothetical protein n=1 Tax=Nitrosopumilus sp. b1 TaxID=2109907 RepID=UPI0015F378A0